MRLPRAREFDAVTIDAFGTLVELDDPVGRLGNAVARFGVTLDPEAVTAGFAAEVAYYVDHKLEAAEEGALRRLRRDCAAVFLEEAGAQLDPDEFAPSFTEALVFRPVAGAAPAVRVLRRAGLALACVSNWDIGLGEQLARAGLGHVLDAVVSSAELGVEKPDPGPFHLACEHLGVGPERALHVGDDEADRAGAEAAGMTFAPHPLATLPARLGL